MTEEVLKTVHSEKVLHNRFWQSCKTGSYNLYYFLEGDSINIIRIRGKQ